ncbi:hypothetical protein SAMN02745857_00905 [Andreprevotia lacus DSM 23236]|jgi:hypothetical protein|uniref:Uncharacterized protein n=1 Tax=Andreprevotia lacus DSM 23236 TaxID=1121001 RepID=A0A1W1X8R5_9NEIS|nr:hypothetical protein [Andreprevotia lacus]SMC20309.1 hypothetical protein SAMN02745857_00905 [Andreprevotia lacus DSM 23236]
MKISTIAPLFALLAASQLVQANCNVALKLQGSVSVKRCDKQSTDCIPASDAVYQYTHARKDDADDELVIALHGSPWHVYDPDYHIIDMAELAALVRQQGSQIKHVTLLSSWSGIAPTPDSKSLAQQLSAALKGMPVSGQDGFVWFAKDGSVSTTHQAFTLRDGGAYMLARGDKVMASLAAGWPAALEERFVKEGDAGGLMRSGVGHDMLTLCPARALQTFEASAVLGNPVAAYNAALMHLEAGEFHDTAKARTLLRQAAKLGDAKAKAKLASLDAGH